MQKSITSFFGGPKSGGGPPPGSPPKSRTPPSAGTSPKAQNSPKNKGNGVRTKAKPSAAATGAAAGQKSLAKTWPASPNKNLKDTVKDNANAVDGNKSPCSNVAEKRKIENEEDADSERGSAGDARGDGGSRGVNKGEEQESSVRHPKRLRRLGNAETARDSDDDVFGAGGENENDSDAGDSDLVPARGEESNEAPTVASSSASVASSTTSGSVAKKNTATSYTAQLEDKAEPEPDTADDNDMDDSDGSDHDADDDEDITKAAASITSTLMSSARKPAAAKSAAKKKGLVSVKAIKAKINEIVSTIKWKKGQEVPYAALVEMFHLVEQTSSRLEITQILCQFLCTVLAFSPGCLASVIYLSCNQLAPAYKGMELGIGDAVLQKAIQGATGRSAKDVKTAATKAGDLGEVAQHSTKAQGTLAFGQTVKTLSANEVLERFRGIAKVKGSMSQEEKINRIKKMLVSCKGLQAKYIIRGLQGRMRMGLNEATVMVSLSHAAVLCPSEAALAAPKEEGQQTASGESASGSPAQEDLSAHRPDEGGGGDDNADEDDLIPIARKLRDTKPREEEQRLELATQLVKQAYSECPNIDVIINAILSAPLYRLQQICRLTPGVPVSPMLAKPTKSIGEVLQRLSGQEFTCEYKYDGMRAQVHLLADGSIKFFSRNSKDSSGELPDVIPVMQECVTAGVQTYVIDSEVVAYDRDTGNLLPFQMLSTRGRKDVDAKDVKVKVIVEAFDIIYLNGQSLLQIPLNDRRAKLRDTFKEVEGRFRFATYMDHKEDGDTGPIEEFLAEAVRGNCEGLMVKTLTDNASYEPSKRSLNWLKLKKDYLQADGGGVGDSLDLVPIGAFHGKGKRTGKYGSFLLACYDPDTEEFQSVCKISTGFTDLLLDTFWNELKEHTLESKRRYYKVSDVLKPDVWLDTVKVWEVKCADLTKSPVHKAAIGKIDPDRGISIRFPRLLRERDDKKPEEATTADQILDMYESQDVIKNNVSSAQADNADDDWEL